MEDMKVVKIPINEVREAPYNANVMDRKKFSKLIEHIKKNKTYAPLYFNKRTGNIAAGNHRLRALKELGYKDVFVVVIDMSLKEEMAFSLFCNKNIGEFNQPSLPMIFNALESDKELLLETGFEISEIFRILDTHTVHSIEEFNPEAELHKKAITKPGDIIQLNKHKIACGNTEDPVLLKKLLGNDTIELLHMDLPFGCEFDPDNRPHLPNDKKHPISALPIKNDDLIGDSYIAWVRQVITAIKPFLSDKAPLYLWSGFINFGPMTQLLVELGFHVSNVITWIKPVACPGFGSYKFASEFLLYAFPKGQGKLCWYGPKNETNVWEIDRQEGISTTDLHPTVKATALARRVLRNSSQRGGIVFDGVMGVGFNLLACEQMGRIFRGIDCQGVYIDIAVKRYAQTYGLNSLSSEIRDKYFGGKGAL